MTDEMSELPDRKVLDWLGINAVGIPRYLCPLNLTVNEDSKYDLQIFQQVAELLAATIWAEIIRSASWPYCLAGCSCLLASGRAEFFDDLCFRFEMGSFIAPQIAVTLGLLHGSSARAFFETLLSDPIVQENPKQAVSINEVLSRIGHPVTKNVQASSWDALQLDDAILAEEVVKEHWDFWKTRL